VRDWLNRTLTALAVIVAFPLTIWAALAIYFDSPIASLRTFAAILYLVGALAALALLRRKRRWPIVAYIGFGLVSIWWLSMRPLNKQDWKSNQAKTASAIVNGDRVIFENIRNCDYRTELEYTCRWETRSYDLTNIRGVDLFITWWGSPWIAHPITSFDFGNQGHLAMSIETREAAGQSYSAIRGFFHQYALAYTVSDERDVIRLRTNYRKGEEVYLFRTTIDPALARKVFLRYSQRVNLLHQHPEWYNALTNNARPISQCPPPKLITPARVLTGVFCSMARWTRCYTRTKA